MNVYEDEENFLPQALLNIDCANHIHLRRDAFILECHSLRAGAEHPE